MTNFNIHTLVILRVLLIKTFKKTLPDLLISCFRQLLLHIRRYRTVGSLLKFITKKTSEADSEEFEKQYIFGKVAMNQVKLVSVILFYFPLSYFFHGHNDSGFSSITWCKNIFKDYLLNQGKISTAYNGTVFLRGRPQKICSCQ